MRPRSSVLLALLCCAVLLTAAVAAPTAAHAEDEEDYHVQLDGSGDAVVTERMTYDLDDETERETFEQLLANETARAVLADRHENRMAALAENASEATGREMAIDRASAVVSETDDVGVVALTTSWSGLGAVDGDRVVVTEPFASGFNPGVPVTVTAPRGYEVVAATPEPTDRTGTAATWEEDADLEGFEFAAEPADEGGAIEVRSEGDGAGFGVVAAIAGVLAALAIAARTTTTGLSDLPT